MVVALVGLLIVWLFGRLSDDRAEAQAQAALLQSTTTSSTTSTSTTIVQIDDSQRLCSLAAAFRTDLEEIPINLVNRAGDSLRSVDDPPIDVGMHPDGDIPEEVRRTITVAAAEAEASGVSIPDTTLPESTTVAAPPSAEPPPAIIDPNRIDPLESGLLGEPQRVALNFYTAASTLRLGDITADFADIADHFATFVEIGESADWDLEELEQSEVSDQWTALATRPPFGVSQTLDHIETNCSIRIGSGFVYREEAPELPILEEVFVPGLVDPAANAPSGNDNGDDDNGDE